MTKAEALYKFWSSFGWVTVDEDNLYDEDTMKELGDPSFYISYESGAGELGNKLSLSSDLWHNSTSWETVEAKAEEIFDAISPGGIFIPYAGGALWITRPPRPYYRLAADENTRRIHFNINAEYLSA